MAVAVDVAVVNVIAMAIMARAVALVVAMAANRHAMRLEEMAVVAVIAHS